MALPLLISSPQRTPPWDQGGQCPAGVSPGSRRQGSSFPAPDTRQGLRGLRANGGVSQYLEFPSRLMASPIGTQTEKGRSEGRKEGWTEGQRKEGRSMEGQLPRRTSRPWLPHALTNPALQARAGSGLHHVWGVHPDIQAQHQRHTDRLHLQQARGEV